MTGPVPRARLLVVDDVADLREMMAWSLGARGFSVTEAAGGKEAIRLARQERFDLVITDLEMPEGDGFTLLSDLKAMNPLYPGVFIITGMGEGIVEEAYAKGAESVLIKPFMQAALLEAIERFMQPGFLAAVPPSHATKRIEIPITVAVDKAPGAACLFGRGGMFVNWTADLPPKGEVLGFTLNIQGMQPQGRDQPALVDGLGIVRWTRPAGAGRPAGFGLEFTYMPEHARRYLAHWSAQRAVIPFIPN